ncbi:MAG: hypothetical protein DESF_00169 [Desulfovibrio sp.]
MEYKAALKAVQPERSHGRMPDKNRLFYSNMPLTAPSRGEEGTRRAECAALFRRGRNRGTPGPGRSGREREKPAGI